MDVEAAIERLRHNSLARTYVLHSDNSPPIPAVIPFLPNEDGKNVRSLVRYLSDALGSEAVSLVTPAVVYVNGLPIETVIAAVTWREGEEQKTSAHVFTVRRNQHGQIVGCPTYEHPPEGLDGFLRVAIQDILSPVTPGKEDIAFAVQKLQERNFFPPILEAKIGMEEARSFTIH
jgi:hypothetical protein